MSDDTSHYEGALLEEINERLKGIAEGQEALAAVPADVADLKASMINVEADIKTIKHAVKDLSRDVRSLGGPRRQWGF
jgi:predicted  nucleic acid-binding Zn-ribbon protein